MTQLSVCWSQIKTNQHQSALMLPLIVDGLRKHFPIFKSNLHSLIVDLIAILRPTTVNTSSTIPKLLTIELLRYVLLVHHKTIRIDTLTSVRTIVESLANDTDPIVRLKCRMALSSAPTLFSVAIKLYDFPTHNSISWPAKCVHECDTNWCRNTEQTNDYDQQIWSVVRRVEKDIHFLYTKYTNNALSLEQVRTINDLPWKYMKQT